MKDKKTASQNYLSDNEIARLAEDENPATKTESPSRNQRMELAAAFSLLELAADAHSDRNGPCTAEALQSAAMNFAHYARMDGKDQS